MNSAPLTSQGKNFRCPQVKKAKVILAVSLLLILSSSIFSSPELILAQTTENNPHDWPTLQGNESRTGYTESASPNDNQTFWKFQTGAAIKSSPAVAAGVVFVASTDGYLYAVNFTSGKEIWRLWVGQVVSSPTVALDKVFITSPNTLFAVDAETGLQVWNQSIMGASGFDAPLVVDNRVFVGSNQTVVSYNPVVGARLYEEPIYHTKGILRLVFSSNLVVAVNLLGNTIPDGAEVGLTGFEARNGRGRFSVALDPLINFHPIEGLEKEQASFSVVTKNSTGSCVFMINTLGMIQWNRQIDGTTTASPALAYNRVYVPTATGVSALNLEDGSVNWSIPLSSTGSASSPAVAGGKLFLGLDDGYVYALDAYSGDTFWTYKTEGAVHSSPAISDGVLFVGSVDGNLYAIGQPVEQIPEFSPLLICFVALAATIVLFIACRKSGTKLSNTNLRKERK